MRYLFDFFGALVISSICIVLAVSFASIVYTGPLEQFLARGIGTTLLAASIAMFIGTFLFSFRGTIINTQDLTAVLLASAAASVAGQLGPSDPEAVFASVLMTLAVAAAATGLVMLALGHFRLGNIIRFIPFPVMGGFLAATGYLLATGSIGTLLGVQIGLGSFHVAFEDGNHWTWLPWMIAAGLVLIAVRTIRTRSVLPISIAFLALAFFAFLLVTGTDMQTAAAKGWLLGPFPSGSFLSEVRPSSIVLVDWGAISGQFLTIAAVVVMAVLGAGLNLSGVELAVDKQLQPDRDFMATGLGNLVAAPTGGLISYPGIASTILAHRFGARGPMAGMIVSASFLAVAFGGVSVLEVLPKGLFAATIAFLGFDLLYTWVWLMRSRLVLADYAIILVILAISIALGFLEALAVGLVGSILIFVVSYSRQNFLRVRSNLALRSSKSERDLADIETLRTYGDRVSVFEFTGYLFFGTATLIKAQIQEVVSRNPSALDAAILDFTRVQGIDPSAAQSLEQLIAFCRRHDIRPVFSGMSDATLSKYQRFSAASDGETAEIHGTLDNALHAEEERLLSSYGSADSASAVNFSEALRLEYPDFDFEERFETVEVASGGYLFRAGDTENDMYLLASGSVRVTILTPQGEEVPIARLLEGALIGEIAYFGDNRRSAGIVAETDARFHKISKESLTDLQHTDPAFIVSFLNLAARYMARRLDRLNRQFGAVLD